MGDKNFSLKYFYLDCFLSKHLLKVCLSDFYRPLSLKEWSGSPTKIYFFLPPFSLLPLSNKGGWGFGIPHPSFSQNCFLLPLFLSLFGQLEISDLIK